jgi:hypothetical protein
MLRNAEKITCHLSWRNPQTAIFHEVICLVGEVSKNAEN